MRHALVFGGSGQIGRPLLAILQREGWRITAVSRNEQSNEPGLQWLRGELGATVGLPARVDAIISCGPLDAFAQWYAQASIDCPRVIAFGSTSIDVKRGSADAEERDVARRLREGEQALFSTAQARNAAATVLRPTLVYGAGRAFRCRATRAACASRCTSTILPPPPTPASRKRPRTGRRTRCLVAKR